MDQQPTLQREKLPLLTILLAAVALTGLPSVAIAGTPVSAKAPVAAAEPPPSGLEAWFMQDYMLGDWGGLRTDLASNGIGFEFFYIGSMPTNMHGGIAEGTEYQGAMLLITDLDFEKMGLWKGGRLHVSGVDLHGGSFSADHVGDFNKSNLVDFESDFRLWEAYYEQKMFNNKVTVKLGLMVADMDFILPDFYHSLQNITFINQTFFFPTLVFNLYDVPGFPVGNHALNSSPYGSLGAVIKWEPTKDLYFKYGIYDGQPNLDSGGTDFSLSSEQGALMFFETGIRWNCDNVCEGLPGDIKFGAFYHTDEFYDVKDVIHSLAGLSAGTKTHDGNYGFYALLEQMLVCEEGCRKDKGTPTCQGLYSFLRFTGAPADRNLTQFGVDGGFVFRGLIPGRDWDTLGIGGSYLQMSDDIRDGQNDINKLAPGTFVVADYEAAIEVNYKVQLAAWWTIQPSFQYAIHPGGSSAIDNAWVFILQSTLRF